MYVHVSVRVWGWGRVCCTAREYDVCPGERGARLSAAVEA